MTTITKWTAAALACGIVLSIGLSANAQVAAGQGRHGQRMAKIAQELGLTDSQKAQIKPILKDAKAQKKAIEADAKLTTDDKHTKLRDLHKQTWDKINGVLTPEQKAKWETLRKEHAKEHRTTNPG
jgi:Spy/CpxP family protein refolding chaperone